MQTKEWKRFCDFPFELFKFYSCKIIFITPNRRIQADPAMAGKLEETQIYIPKIKY